MDLQNGLAACPLHDAAFDQGFVTIDTTYVIMKASILQANLDHDYRASVFYEDALSTSLRLPPGAHWPARHYLAYHWQHCFKGV